MHHKNVTMYYFPSPLSLPFSTCILYLHTCDVLLQCLLERGHWELHQLVSILMHLSLLVPPLPLWGQLGELQSRLVMLVPARLGGHQWAWLRHGRQREPMQMPKRLGRR